MPSTSRQSSTPFSGGGHPHRGPIIGHSWGNDPAVQPYPYDPEQAKALLAGGRSGRRLHDQVLGARVRLRHGRPEEIGQIVQANLAEVGVTAEIVTQWTSYVADWQNKGLDEPLRDGRDELELLLARSGRVAQPNVMTAPPARRRLQRLVLSNPEVDDLLTKATQTFNQDERRHFKQAQAIMREDCPWIFMFSANNVVPRRLASKDRANSDPSVISLSLAYFE